MLKIGHRGACGYCPENTLVSFQKALDLKIDMIELDVFKCLSGEIVVIHDHYLGRLTNGSGYVEKKTLNELKSYKIHDKEQIPTLNEVLDLIDGKVQVNIELKGKNTSHQVKSIIKGYLSKKWSLEHFLISSFNHKELYTMKKEFPEIRLGVLFDSIPLNYKTVIRKIKPYSVHLNLKYLNEHLIDSLHQEGYFVYVYTVNEISEIKRVKNMNADGIFSDFPDRIKVN